MKRIRWTRNQLLQALTLYHQIPFGRMHARNPTIIAMSEQIGRTPSALALKLVNFASLDPELRGRGIGGMGNTSKADREIWGEFNEQWDELAKSAASLDSLVLEPDVADGVEAVDHIPSGPTEERRVVKVRTRQRFFRNAVLAAYDGRCCITGISSGPLLRASHIIPWSRNTKLRLNPGNGLCLNALHDAAFDRGLITLSNRFEVIVSGQLADEIPANIYREMFADIVGKQITLPERHRPLLEALEDHRSRFKQ